MKSINILLLTIPCHGFGDIIFSIKLKNYLEKWYPNSNIYTATTRPEMFEKFNKKGIIKLVPKSAKTSLDCRRFSKLKFENKSHQNRKYHLMFVAPLLEDFDINRSDVKNLIPYSNKYNTLFINTYNATSKADIPLGLGKGKYGLFINKDIKIPKSASSTLNQWNLKSNDYFFVWISYTEGAIPYADKCFLSFVEMLIKKYKNDNKIEIVIPPWITMIITDSYHFNPSSNLKKLLNMSKGYTIKYITKQGTLFEFNRGSKQLILRGDILPVQQKDVMILMKFSKPEILLTGTQSFSDLFSCCNKKILFYQTVPWHENLAKQLAKILPNKYLEHKKTSCGSIKAVNLKPHDFNHIIKKYDFEVLAKPKIDKVINNLKKLKEQ